MRASGVEGRLLFFSALLLGLAVTWFRPGPILLIGGDAGIYARVARELAERPLSEWLQLTLDGQGFFEHPPLALWIEALAFKLFGASVVTAVSVARAWATVTLLLVGLAARKLARSWSVGAYAVLGLLAIPGFIYESQVAMLEAPLTTFLAMGILFLPLPEGRGLGRGAALFAAAVVAGFWTKGPPALVLIGVVVALAALRKTPWRAALVTVAAAILAVVLTTFAFDALRASRGLEPFFSRYLASQVFPSLTEGRHNPDRNPFFYVMPLVFWYWPGLLAGAAAIVPAIRKQARFATNVALTGGILWLGVIAGFSAATQKYQWYIHPGAVGAALLLASIFALIPERFERRLSLGIVIAALFWPLVTFIPWKLTPMQEQVYAVQRVAAPDGADRRVADCSEMESWASEHLMGFAWRAKRVACDAPAAFSWDGRELRAKTN